MTTASLSGAGAGTHRMTARDGRRLESPEGVPARPVAYRRAKIASGALFGVAAALAAVFLVHIAKFEATAPTSPAAESAPPEGDRIAVTTSTLTGFDDDRQPYRVSAASAVQDTAEPNLVHLESVSGELRRRSGAILSLAAERALFDSKQELLQLAGDVTLVTAGRFVAEMDEAEVTLSDKRLRSQSQVDVRFDRGRITAGGIEISEDGNRVVFLNRAKVTFGPQTKGDMLK